jgi:hypothetical protein
MPLGYAKRHWAICFFGKETKISGSLKCMVHRPHMPMLGGKSQYFRFANIRTFLSRA